MVEDDINWLTKKMQWLEGDMSTQKYVYMIYYNID